MAAVIAVPVVVPLLVVVGALTVPQPEVWTHLREHVLLRVLANTLWLVVLVNILSGIIGTTLAWLTVHCRFPGSRQFSWALLLPLAMPAYVTAFVAIGMLEYAGPVQSALRDWFGPDAALPPIRSRGGVVAVLTLALYPYVYLLARAAFLSQGRRALEVAGTLGLNRRQAFRRVSLPLARPWIAGGMILVSMETLADFGTVAVFNYDTFTTAIYSAWFSLFSIEAALQLASLLILLALAVVAGERWLRTNKRYNKIPADQAASSGIRLRGWHALAASGFAGTVLAAGFLLPFAQLLIWSARHASRDLDWRYWSFAAQSIGLGLMAAVLVTAVATLLAYAVRRDPRPVTRGFARLATLGYALPGAVLAVGIFVPLAALSSTLDRLLQSALGPDMPALLLQSSLLTLLLAYLVRFLAVAYSPVESGLLRVTPSIDDASRALGIGGSRMLWRIHLPMLRGGLATAAMLVFVDVMKEMPITLMTRPFGWETLATRVFEMTAEGEWQRAALPAVAIVLVGLLPVWLIMKGARDAA